jgi:hypothetical protein
MRLVAGSVLAGQSPQLGRRDSAGRARDSGGPGSAQHESSTWRSVGDRGAEHDERLSDGCCVPVSVWGRSEV